MMSLSSNAMVPYNHDTLSNLTNGKSPLLFCWWKGGTAKFHVGYLGWFRSSILEFFVATLNHCSMLISNISFISNNSHFSNT